MDQNLDPTKFRVDTTLPPIWESEESFQEIMAEQLRHAPWLLLSIMIHGLAVLVVLLMPSTKVIKPEKAIEMAPPPEVEEIIEEQEEEEEPEEEEPVEEPVLQDTEVTEVDTVAQTEDFSDVKESAFDSNQWNSAVGLGGGAGGKFGGRGGGRKALARGGKQTASAIELGLEWLKAHQDDEGFWDADEFMKHDVAGEPCDGAGNALHDVGLTGLALLAFLGDGSDMKKGPYQDVVKKGIRWLRKQQDKESGLIGNNNFGEFIYNHAIAAYALVEAYGLSDYKILRKNAQLAMDYLEYHRNPYSVWRYQPRDNDNDTSITGWCVMAYTSADYFGLDVNKEALDFAETWFAEKTDNATGRTGYFDRGSGSSRKPGVHGQEFPVNKGECMTAVALMCRFFMGQDPNENEMMAKQADLIARRPPLWSESEGSIDHYYWYYGSYAMFQMGSFGGKNYWKDWSKHLTPNVVNKQRTDGNYKGSWDPAGAWGEDGGRVYSTAILVLTLEAFYRYTTLVR